MGSTTQVRKLAATVERSVLDGAEAGFILDMDDGRTIVIFERKRELDRGDAAAFQTFCLRCLIDEHPELGCGLDLALEYGAAAKVDGRWEADPG